MVLSLLSGRDEPSLSNLYPGLASVDGTMTGAIAFRASYNREENRFVVLKQGDSEPDNAVTLSGSFEIRIAERSDKSVFRLPALFVPDVEPIPARHFGADKTACLCSPFEEDDFLNPEFRWGPFLEQLVIPFLYGQVFYTAQGHWPWAEYAHYETGILEAYFNLPDQSKAEQCLRMLSRYSSWPAMRSGLAHKPFFPGHTPCFCGQRKPIRRCHRRALDGALRLQRDVRALGLTLPGIAR
jgi:hypothetical protein